MEESDNKYPKYFNNESPRRPLDQLFNGPPTCGGGQADRGAVLGAPLGGQGHAVQRVRGQVAEGVAGRRGRQPHLLRGAVSGDVRQPVAAELSLGFLPAQHQRGLRRIHHLQVFWRIQI